MSVRIAAVAPNSVAPPDDEKNVADAVRFVEQAAAQGADFVTFPESYPGPWRMPATFDPHAAMIDVAARCGVYVIYGTIEPLEGQRAYNLVCMASPTGERLTPYRRTHPVGPWIYSGGDYWDFEYVAGQDFPVYPTEHGVVGLAMCSEVYVPEVARGLALGGAEIIFMPAGLTKTTQLPTWRNLIWSRAIENLAIVVTTQNLFGPQESGLAMVAGPETILFESSVAGMFMVDVDLARLRELRDTQDITEPELPATKRGLLSAQWHRPELAAKMGISHM